VTHTENDTQERNASQETFEAMLREKLQQAVRTALIGVLEAEVDAFIGAVRYERSEQRRDYRNGHYRRSLDTSIGHIDDLPVPPHAEAIRPKCLNAIIAAAHLLNNSG
jgi:transposase-like protein